MPFGFGKALDVLRDGDAVRREGWDTTRFVILVPGSPIEVAADRPLGRALPALVGQLGHYQPHLDLVSTAYGLNEIEQWAPTHADLLAQDWDYATGPER